MTESNWRAQHRAGLWEHLYSIADELMELAIRWEANDPEMASWELDGGVSAEPEPMPCRNKKSTRARKRSV